MRILILIFSLLLSLNAYECKNCENLYNKTIKKVYASNPTLMYQLYAVDKSKAVGLNFEFWDIEKEYLDKEFFNLPVVGGFFGQGRTPNIEQVLSLKPDLIISSTYTTDLYKEIFEKTKIPILYIDAIKLEDSLESFKILGEILGTQKRANLLYDYAKNSLNLAKEISSKIDKKPRIYYAYSEDGLQSECGKSSFGNLVSLVGGKMVHECDKTGYNSRINLNFEQVFNYNPDVIIVYHKAFYDKIFSDKKWALLNAVKNKKVFLIPRKPFSWVGKPASFMRFLGIRWLLQTLHPEISNLDMHKETREFYKLFLYIDLDEIQIEDILNERN